MIAKLTVTRTTDDEYAVVADGGEQIFDSPAPEDAVFFARGIAWAINNCERIGLEPSGLQSTVVDDQVVTVREA